MIYLRLFYEFFKTGLFAIGGGLATLPFLYDMSIRTGWFTPDDIANMIAISQSTPGPLGINMAAYTGYLTGGIAGAIIAPIGLVMPSLLIILAIAGALAKRKESQGIRALFYGLKPASFAMIMIAWLRVVNLTYHPAALLPGRDPGGEAFFWQGLLLAGGLYFILQKWKLHPIFVVVLAGALGMLLRL